MGASTGDTSTEDGLVSKGVNEMITAKIEREGSDTIITATSDYWFVIDKYLYGCSDDGAIDHTFVLNGRVTFVSVEE